MRRWLICVAALFLGPGSAPAAADEWRLSTLGYGPARFGMSLDEAAQALGVELIVDGEIDAPDCHYANAVPAIEDLSIMVSRGRIVRFDVTGPGIKTRSGLGVGDDEVLVREALAAQSLEVTPHKYVAPDGSYLTVWSAGRRSAVRFETLHGKVTSFYAGRVPHVTYVEGCA